MNTSTIATIKDAIITTLLADKPSLKISDKLNIAISDAIASNLPDLRIAKPSAEVLSAYTKALSERNILVDTQDFTIVHVADSQLFSRHEGKDGDLIAAHSYKLDQLSPTWDTILQLATVILLEHKRARPEKLRENNNLNLHLCAEGLEALQLINGDVTLEGTRLGAGGKTEKNYQTVIADMGLSDFIPHLHPDYNNGVNYQHADDNSAITLYVADLQTILGYLTATDKKGLLTCTTAIARYDAAVATVLDDNYQPVFKLRFTVTKA